MKLHPAFHPRPLSPRLPSAKKSKDAEGSSKASRRKHVNIGCEMTCRGERGIILGREEEVFPETRVQGKKKGDRETSARHGAEQDRGFQEPVRTAGE